MNLTLERKILAEDHTIGKLSIDGVYFCDTLEDKCRDLSTESKIKGETAIPYGTYRVTLDIQSPRFKNSNAYKFCDGYLPRLLDVPHFDGILIHIGNYPKDTDGCILVGKNTLPGMVASSAATFKTLYNKLKESTTPITIEIK